MQGATIALGMIVAVIVLVLFSSTRMRAQGPPGSQGPLGSQGPSGSQGPWGPNQGPTQSPQQRQGYTGTPSGSYGGGRASGGSSSGLLRFFAIIGVLAVLGACGLMFLVLQGALQ